MFSYDQFRALKALDLVTYMNPFADDVSNKVPERDLRRMLRELDSYDEYHLVFALELGTRGMPTLYAPVLPKYLGSHYADSVRFAANSALRSLPRACVTNQLMDEVSRVLNESQDNLDWRDDLLRSLEQR